MKRNNGDENIVQNFSTLQQIVLALWHLLHIRLLVTILWSTLELEAKISTSLKQNKSTCQEMLEDR